MGELTVIRATEYDPTRHISISDIAIDSSSKPSMIELVLKCSKTDQLSRRAQIYLGKTDTELYPVTALLAVRGMEPGPLFKWYLIAKELCCKQGSGGSAFTGLQPVMLGSTCLQPNIRWSI